jgi:hypothetical protein
MAVPNDDSRAVYAGTGSTTLFPVPFYFLTNAHIVATYVTSAGVETGWTEGSDYTLTGAGDEDGGTLTATVAPVSGSSLVIRRIVPITQETRYPRNDPFPAASHERALDKLTMIAQQHAESVGRAIKFPLGETPVRDTIQYLATRRTKVAGWDELGRPATTLSTMGQVDTAVQQVYAALANLPGLIGFASVSGLEGNGEDLPVGTVARLGGYHQAGDGGGGDVVAVGVGSSYGARDGAFTFVDVRGLRWCRLAPSGGLLALQAGLIPDDETAAAWNLQQFYAAQDAGFAIGLTAGDWYFSDRLALGDGAAIVGVGRDRCRVVMPAMDGHWIEAVADELGGFSGIYLGGFTLTGGAQGPSGFLAGIYLRNVDDAVIENMAVIDADDTAIYWVDCRNGRITNNYVETTDEAVFLAEEGCRGATLDGCNDCLVEANTVVRADFGFVDQAQVVIIEAGTTTGAAANRLVDANTRFDDFRVYDLAEVQNTTNATRAKVAALSAGGPNQRGTATSTSAGKLVDSAANFTTNGCFVGAVIKRTILNDTLFLETTVSSIDSATQLTLADDIFVSGDGWVLPQVLVLDGNIFAAGEGYKITSGNASISQRDIEDCYGNVYRGNTIDRHTGHAITVNGIRGTTVEANTAIDHMGAERFRNCFQNKDTSDRGTRLNVFSNNVGIRIGTLCGSQDGSYAQFHGNRGYQIKAHGAFINNSPYTTVSNLSVFGGLGKAIWFLRSNQSSARSIKFQGPQPWNPRIMFEPGGWARPSVQNGYYYTSDRRGVAGSVEPTWPTTIGATVTETGGAGIVWTCAGTDDRSFQPSAWTANTVYILGNVRRPTVYNGGFTYEVLVAGTSGATEPTWPTTIGNTVTDGTVTWRCRKTTGTGLADIDNSGRSHLTDIQAIGELNSGIVIGPDSPSVYLDGSYPYESQFADLSGRAIFPIEQSVEFSVGATGTFGLVLPSAGLTFGRVMYQFSELPSAGTPVVRFGDLDNLGASDSDRYHGDFSLTATVAGQIMRPTLLRTQAGYDRLLTFSVTTPSTGGKVVATVHGFDRG